MAKPKFIKVTIIRDGIVRVRSIKVKYNEKV